MSTSPAPFWMALAASKALTSGVLAPSGNPITVHTLTGVPASCSAQYATQVGFTHTEANSYFFASSVSLVISAFVASARKRVWSINAATFISSVSFVGKLSSLEVFVAMLSFHSYLSTTMNICKRYYEIMFRLFFSFIINLKT
ncbi:hypothetical protein D3C81_1147890 [compost metagenome]